MLKERKKQSKRLKQKQGRKKKELKLEQGLISQWKKQERGRDELKKLELSVVMKK